MKNRLKMACLAIFTIAGQVYSSQVQLVQLLNLGAQNICRLAALSSSGLSRSDRSYFIDEKTGFANPLEVNQQGDLVASLSCRGGRKIVIPQSIIKAVEAGLQFEAKNQKESDFFRAELYNNSDNAWVSEWHQGLSESFKRRQLEEFNKVLFDSNEHSVLKKLIQQDMQRRQEKTILDVVVSKAEQEEQLDYAGTIAADQEKIEAINRSVQEYYDALGDIDSRVSGDYTLEEDIMKGNAVFHVINGKDSNVGDFPEIRAAIEKEELLKRRQQAEADWLRAELYNDNPEVQKWLDAYNWDNPKENSFDWKEFAKDNKEQIAIAGIIAAGAGAAYVSKDKLQQKTTVEV